MAVFLYSLAFIKLWTLSPRVWIIPLLIYTYVSAFHFRDSLNNPTPMKMIPKFLITMLMMKVVSTVVEI